MTARDIAFFEVAIGEPGGGGPTGPAGPTGPKGMKGMTGPTGPAGADGATGMKGMTGLDGATGEQGPRGPEGATGVQGPQGPDGATGVQGDQGPQGPEGATGAQGNEGATGTQGPDGATGAQGDDGATGAQGPEGATGAQGNDGATGAQGPEGATGAQGNDGATGAQGPEGATGAQGDEGATGTQGPEGATGPQGDTGPAGADGADGAVGLAGATGPKGDQGDLGPTGATGSQGPEGATGAQGNDGATGAQGPEGATGAQGNDGATGAQGPEGATGAQGDEGATGTQGPEGATGPQGDTGATGADGATGPVGPAGASGADGATGPNGSQGPTGPIGPQGDTGPAGANGADGADGAVGLAGPTGPKGDEGDTGPAGGIVCEDENSNSASCAHSLDTSNGSIFNQLHIDTTGNVGIGINPVTETAPVELVHLDQTGANSNVRVQFSNASSGATAVDGTYIGIDDGDFGGVFQSSFSIWNREANSRILFGTNNTQRMVINQLGRVGINENLPGAMLTVRGVAGTLYMNPDFNLGTVTAFQSKDTDLVLATGNVEQMRIMNTPKGNVGINTADPQAQLHVDKGSVLVTDADILIRSPGGVTGGNIGVNLPVGVFPSHKVHVAGPAPLARIRVEAYGGGASSFICADVSGVMFAQGTACDISVAASKQNITDLGLGLDAVLALRPVTFDWRPGYNLSSQRQLGFIAEEVAAVSPLLAAHDDGTGALTGVHYAQMSALLTEGVQELAAKVRQLEALAAAGVAAPSASDVRAGSRRRGQRGDVATLERHLDAQQRTIEAQQRRIDALEPLAEEVDMLRTLVEQLLDQGGRRGRRK